jgi:hypothetical protein
MLRPQKNGSWNLFLPPLRAKVKTANFSLSFSGGI